MELTPEQQQLAKQQSYLEALKRTDPEVRPATMEPINNYLEAVAERNRQQAYKQQAAGTGNLALDIGNRLGEIGRGVTSLTAETLTPNYQEAIREGRQPSLEDVGWDTANMAMTVGGAAPKLAWEGGKLLAKDALTWFLPTVGLTSLASSEAGANPVMKELLRRTANYVLPKAKRAKDVMNVPHFTRALPEEDKAVRNEFLKELHHIVRKNELPEEVKDSAIDVLYKDTSDTNEVIEAIRLFLEKSK